MDRLSLREEHKELTRARVLDAAVTVLGKKTFLDATVDDVARAAGVTRATVYAHFNGGKSEIVQALVARVYASATEAYTELAAAEAWTRVGLRTWLDDLVERWRELSPTIRVLTTAGASLARREGPGERYMAAHEHYISMLTGDHRWPGIPEPEARQRVLLAVLQIESFLTVWLSGGWDASGSDPIDLLVDAVSHLLRPALRD